MDISPFKRRKTSSASSINVTDKNTQLQTKAKKSEAKFDKRASFLSPTKASLARFNPDLLQTTKPIVPPRRRGSSGSQGAHSETLSVRGGLYGGTVTRAKSTEPSTAPPRSTPTLNPKANGQALRLAQRHRLRSPGGNERVPGESKTAVNGHPRASPPEGGEEENTGVFRAPSHEEEIMNEDNRVQDAQVERQKDVVLNGADVSLRDIDVAGAMSALENPQLPFTPSHSRLQGSSSGMVLQEDGEPSLPSTPIHLGLEDPPGSPKGLLFDSPSKRPKRKGNARAKPSPLKPQSADLEQPSWSSGASCPSLGPRVYIAHTPRPPLTAQEAALLGAQERLTKLEKQLQGIEDDLIRNLLVAGWEGDDGRANERTSKREKEILAKSTNITRLREEQRGFESTKVTGFKLTGEQLHDQETIDRSRNEKATLDASYVPSRSRSLSHCLSLFLPFSRRPPPPRPKPPSPEDQYSFPTLNLESPEDGVAPFTITTSDSQLLSGPENTLLQSQTVMLSSTPSALVATVLLTVNVASQSVTKMQVIQVSDWAEEELGEWLRSPPQQRSVKAIGTAFGRYWSMCRQRFECWEASARDYGDLIVDDGVHSGVSSQLTRADLSSLIPRLRWRELHMARGAVCLNVHWHVSISDDGNVSSDVSALPQIPDTWRRTEAGAELDKVGEVFKMLVNDRGAAQATRVVAGLLFPE